MILLSSIFVVLAVISRTGESKNLGKFGYDQSKKYNRNITEKTVWLEQQNVCLLSTQHKFFVGPTKFWLRQQKFCWTNQTHFVNSTKLSLF